MGFAADNHIGAIVSYAKTVYGKKVFSRHFVQRTYERFSPEERLSIFAELRDLVKTGMYAHLFTKGRNTANIILRENIEVVFALQGNSIQLKTAFKSNKIRVERTKLNFDGVAQKSH